MAGKHNAAKVKSLTQPARYTDGNGLHLLLKGADRRTWVLRYLVHGHSRDMGLQPRN